MQNVKPAEKSFIISEIIEYTPDTLVMKTILRKTDENVTAVSFDSDDVFTEKTSNDDTFIQVINGSTEIIINGKSNELSTGQSVIIPAHFKNRIIQKTKFKLTSTTIKNLSA